MIVEDIKYTKCQSCDELEASRGVSTMKGFNTKNLVNYLKSNHCDKFQQIIMNKEAQRKVAKSERIQRRLNQVGGMHHIMS